MSPEFACPSRAFLYTHKAFIFAAFRFPDVGHAVIKNYPTPGKQTSARAALKDDAWARNDCAYLFNSFVPLCSSDSSPDSGYDRAAARCGNYQGKKALLCCVCFSGDLRPHA